VPAGIPLHFATNEFLRDRGNQKLMMLPGIRVN
jgi:hypothetical protein